MKIKKRRIILNGKDYIILPWDAEGGEVERAIEILKDKTETKTKHVLNTMQNKVKPYQCQKNNNEMWFRLE